MANNFIWHKVSEEEKEQIRLSSKRLLEQFAGKLEKIKSKESHFENNSGTREEGTGWETDSNFRNTMFENAHLVEDNSIIAEKGAWKK